MKRHLFLDYETASLRDLEDDGQDNYVKDPTTRILMLAWAIDHGDVHLWLPHEGPMPQELLDAWMDPECVKVAWHAEFEFNITKYVLPRQCNVSIDRPLSEYRDPIILAHNLSLPGKLEKVGEILHMMNQKDERGKKLIKMFSQPANRKEIGKPIKQTSFFHQDLVVPPVFKDWNSHPKEWDLFCGYCKQDVVAERDLFYRLAAVPLPERDWQGWFLNEKINQYGMPTNRLRAEKLLRLSVRFVDGQKQILKTETGLENPGSDAQMKKWAIARGYPWNSLRANYVKAALDDPNSKMTPECRKVLEARSKSRKSSYKKIVTLLRFLSPDDRLRFAFNYMGASRTGRWAGADVQVQNFSRGLDIVKKNLDHALALVDAEDYDGIIREYTDTEKKKDSISVVEFCIALLRCLFEVAPDETMIVADLNAIENRVLGWAAGCKSILDVFRTCTECGFLDENTQGQFHCPKCGCHSSRCPYISFGTQLYGKTYQQMWHEYHDRKQKLERQNSKPCVLGGGYGLGGGEMERNEYGDEVRGGLWGYALNVCGVDMPKDLAHKAVDVFRKSYPEVVRFWYDLEEAFKQVLMNGGIIDVGRVTWDKTEHRWVPHQTSLGCVLRFSRKRMQDGGWMIIITLPSGRAIHYLNATLDQEDRVSKKNGRSYTVSVLHYDGIEHSASTDAGGQKKKKRAKWGRVKTYGGKICENIIQAISRDILLNGMFLADALGFNIFGMFHDELATAVKKTWDGLRVEDLVVCMSDVPSWAPGLILGAEGFETQYYRKD